MKLQDKRLKKLETGKGIMILAIVTLMAALYLLGCASERKEGAEASSQLSEEALDAIYELDTTDPLSIDHVSIEDMGHFSIAADVVLPQRWNPITYEVECLQFADAVKEKYTKLLGADSHLQFETVEDDELYRCYENSDGDYLVGQSGSVAYIRNSENQGLSTFTFQPSTTLHEPYEKKELKGFSRDAAVGKAKEILSEFDLSLPSEFDVFAATKESLNESAQALSKDLSEDTAQDIEADTGYIYDQDDEFYVLFAQEILEGMPVSINNYSSDSENAYGALIRIEIGRTEIQDFDVSNYLKVVAPIDLKGVTSETKPISLGRALQALNDRFSQIVTTDKINIDRISLEYVPAYDKELSSGEKVVPGWAFRNADDPDISYRVNAVNGDIIL